MNVGYNKLTSGKGTMLQVSPGKCGPHPARILPLSGLQFLHLICFTLMDASSLFYQLTTKFKYEPS